MTALIAAATSATMSVKRSALTAWRDVTASQNASTPPSNERATTAASGSRTTTLRYSIETPMASARARRGGAARAGAGAGARRS